VAPEILKNCPYDQSADLWSVGVILYVLLCGYPPFASEHQATLFGQIRTGQWKFAPTEYWEHISQEAKDVVAHLLVVNPHQRWTAKQALSADWFAMELQDDIQEPTVPLPTTKLTSGGMWANLAHMDVHQPSKSVDAVDILAAVSLQPEENPKAKSVMELQRFQI